ncbi:MAG TPA: glycosyltransferase family A protein [Mycobacteriales bacterium]|nr:glycosyltransferase family A protein [Mycobacteriales bacterium]
MTPLVSVVVPTRNVVRTIRACLESVRAQDHSALELIVVDNHSSDGTFEIARDLADVAVRGGPERSAQRNRGVELARGEWVLWIDSDMVLRPSVTRLAVAAAQRTGAVAVSIPELSIGPGFWTACRALERSCYQDDAGLHNPRFIRREVLGGIGGFDAAMAGPEDTDLRLRLRADRATVALAADALIEHDEGRLTLRGVLAKRVYYGRSLPAFAAKNPGALREQGAGTLRALLRHRRLLLRRPGLAAGVVLLRSLEAAAYGIGYWQGRRAERGPVDRP